MLALYDGMWDHWYLAVQTSMVDCLRCLRDGLSAVQELRLEDADGRQSQSIKSVHAREQLP